MKKTKKEIAKNIIKDYSGVNFALTVVDKIKDDGNELVQSVKEMTKTKRGEHYSNEKKDFAHWYEVYNFKAENCTFVYKYSCVYSYIFLTLICITLAFALNASSLTGIVASFSSVMIISAGYIKFASRAYMIRRQDTLHPFGFLKSFDDLLPNYWVHNEVEANLKDKFGK